MSAIAYADFSCPMCYLASLRVDRLRATGRATPDWRAIEHRPRLPLTGLRLGPAAHRLRDRELAAVARLAESGEELPSGSPALLPHTGAAVVAYAEAVGAGVADQVRSLLFRAYWLEGDDIGDPEVLRHLLPPAFATGRATGDPVRDFGYAVTSQRGPVTTAAYRRIRDWQCDWLALGAPLALTLTTDDLTTDDLTTGAAALAALRTSPMEELRDAS
ncbi:DsbA family oxidoreductase [Nocardioides soli]|uniref:2-hydroxychromene-2-carboxylate isomerase n=1 Tax=Nocardioides soli TaxID=1036020 RepID=A0A7W4Z2D6_9ACTN|nr:DsbA family protein [Nocardioides soli]MBB3042530.1 2-hydroxychromene-2-carboxylate isomerase [Nocardioides soli]